jgi:hypothetical protein
MNEGIDIVLKRMETHPEEFVRGQDKWKFIYDEWFREVMTEQEKGAIFDKLKELRRQELTQKVLHKLLQEEQRDSDSLTYSTEGRGAWGINSIQYDSLNSFNAIYKQELEKAIAMSKCREQQTRQQKNKSKMEQLLQRVTGNKY